MSTRERHPRIELILGPMKSGKSTELMRRVNRHRAAKARCFVIQSTTNTRDGPDKVRTHSDHEMKADGSFTTLLEFLAIAYDEEERLRFDVIAIDEAQWFTDLVEACEELADAGAIVLVAGCDCRADSLPFGRFGEMLHRCERVDKFEAVCELCQSEHAGFSLLRHPDMEKLSSSGILVGGDYITVCRSCRAKSRQSTTTAAAVTSSSSAPLPGQGERIGC